MGELKIHNQFILNQSSIFAIMSFWVVVEKFYQRLKNMSAANFLMNRLAVHFPFVEVRFRVYFEHVNILFRLFFFRLTTVQTKFCVT